MIKKRRNSYLLYAWIAAALLCVLFYRVYGPKGIEKIAIISGAGLEQGENAPVKLTVQLIKPNSAETSEAEGVVFSGEGETVAQAAEQIVLQVGSVLYWSHCSVLILQEDFAKEDVVPHLDFFFRSLDYRNMTPIFVSKDSPGDVLNAEVLFDSISGFGLETLLKVQETDNNSVYTDMYEFMSHYYDVNASGLVAGLTLEEEKQSQSGDSGSGGGEDSKMAGLSDCAVFCRGKLQGYIGTDALMGFHWLNNGTKARSITLEKVILGPGQDCGRVSVSLFGVRTKITPEWQDGQWSLRLKITGDAELVSAENGVDFATKDPREISRMMEQLNDILAQKIQEEVDAVWQKMNEYDCDFCGVGKRFYAKYGKRWPGEPNGTPRVVLEEVQPRCDVRLTIVTESLNKRF